MKGNVFISYGMGGAAIETWQSGILQLIQRCRAAGFDTKKSPYQWSDVNQIVGEINATPPEIPVAILGASLGANETTDIATRARRRIRYLGLFQRSSWGYRVEVPSRVDYADNIYNPGLIGWLRTFGMGSVKLYPAAGNVRTIIRNIQIKEAHPDDWGIAQDIIFSALQKTMGAG